MQTLIIGCGYSGKQIQQAERNAGYSVTSTGTKMDADKIRLDLDTGEGLEALSDQHWDRCYYLAPPDARAKIDHRLNRFLQAFEHQPLKNIVYFSTTAVYGNPEGQWVTEHSPLRPANQRGVLRVDAEEQLKTYSQSRNSNLSILRVAGIYGPDRLPLTKLRQGCTAIKPEQAPFSNRIHVSDLAIIAIAAMNTTQGIEVYNVADGQPTTSTEYLQTIARAFNLPMPSLIDIKDAASFFSPMALSFLADNKRVDNHKILTKLNIALKFPDLRSSLANGLKFAQ